MSEPLHCDLCGRAIPPHAHYIVRIDVLADPAMPPLSLLTRTVEFSPRLPEQLP